MALTAVRLVACLASGLLVSNATFARQVEIVLLHTSDVQGHVLSRPDWEHGQGQSGLLRCATLVQEERDQSDNILLLDCGGFLNGSPESWVTEGRLPRNAALWLGYDAMLADDWHLESSHLETIQRWPAVDSGLPPSEVSRWRVRGVEPFRLFELDGIRVGVLGINESMVDHPGWSQSEVEAWGNKILKRSLQEMRGLRPQILVLLWRHSLWSDREDLQRAASLASMFPELDVILGGGSWRARAEERAGRAVYSGAGSQARYLGRVALTYDTVQKETVSRHAELLEPSHEVKELTGLRQVLGGELTRVEVRLDTIMVHSTRRVEGSSDWPGQSGVQHLISLAVQEAIEADLVLYGKQARAALPLGPVRLSDLFRIAPLREEWVAMSLVAADVRAVLEENAMSLGSPSFLGCFGVTYDYHLEADPGMRVQNLRLVDGQKPHGRKRLTVLVPARLVDGEGLHRSVLRGLASQPINRLRRLDIDTQSALVEYVESVDSLDLKAQKGMSRP